MTAKLSMLRFYIATRPKEVEDDASETSDVVLVSSHSSNETSTAQLQVGDATVDFDVQSALEMSVDAEITFGPLHNCRGNFCNPTLTTRKRDTILLQYCHTVMLRAWYIRQGLGCNMHTDG